VKTKGFIYDVQLLVQFTKAERDALGHAAEAAQGDYERVMNITLLLQPGLFAPLPLADLDFLATFLKAKEPMLSRKFRALTRRIREEDAFLHDTRRALSVQVSARNVTRKAPATKERRH
jgi:hypothetical protein